MAVPILGLLILLQFSWISVSDSALIVSKVCGTEEVAYLENLDGHQILINKNRIENSTLVCEKLNFYFEVGCFSCDPKFGVWREIGKSYCARYSDFFLHEEKIVNSGEVSHQFCNFVILLLFFLFNQFLIRYKKSTHQFFYLYIFFIYLSK